MRGLSNSLEQGRKRGAASPFITRNANSFYLFFNWSSQVVYSVLVVCFHKPFLCMRLITLFKASLHLANGSYINNKKKKNSFSIQYLKRSLPFPCSVVSQYAAFFVRKEKHHISYTPLTIKDYGQTVS